MFIYSSPYTKNWNKGFSFVEILVVVAILGLLLALSIPVGIKLLRVEQLDIATDEVIQTLRHAQTLALTQENDASYGVFFASSDYILFKGDSFATRDTAYDQVYSLGGDVNASTTLTGDEVVFVKLSGSSSESGSIILTNSAGSDTIEVNTIGRIALLSGAPLPPSFISQLHYRWRNDDGGE